MTVVTRIEPQYAPQGHILSLKVELKNETTVQALVKIGIGVNTDRENLMGFESIKFRDLTIPKEETILVDLLLDTPILPTGKTMFIVAVSE